MKIRIGFVTNSSSSSFLIAKNYLDKEQLEAIKKHQELSEAMDNWGEWDFAWNIDENEHFITGFTFMDNFSMHDFLNNIGVPEKCVHWSEYAFDLNKEVYVPIKNKRQENKEGQDWRDILHSL